MASFDTFKFWYAASLANNTFVLADANLKIEDFDSASQQIKLIYCIPSQFTKRATDVSNALAQDQKAPDTGSAGSYVTLRFSQEREDPTTQPILNRIMNMYFKFGTDDDFISGRFGLETTDNPQLDCLPISDAGYRLISFKQEPNQDKPALLIYELVLRFLGDHTKLGTRTP